MRIVSAVLLTAVLLFPARGVAQTAVPGVTEFTVNGLKVLVKQRPTSQTVAAGLFIKGGARNITASNAGIEALTLDLATEATANFPRDVLRRGAARNPHGGGFAGEHRHPPFRLRAP